MLQITTHNSQDSTSSNTSKVIRVIIIVLLAISFITALLKYINDPYRQFSKETRDWIKWYSTLTPEERMTVSYFPTEISEAMKNGFVFDLLPE